MWTFSLADWDFAQRYLKQRQQKRSWADFLGIAPDYVIKVSAC